MTRRDMAFQATLALGLIFGIVGGNFVLHRWVLGNAASREASANTSRTAVPVDDLDEFAPSYCGTFLNAAHVDPVLHRELLRKLIARRLPNSSDTEREAWLEELSDESLNAAEGILELRSQVGAFPVIDETAAPRSTPAEPPKFEFSIGISR